MHADSHYVNNSLITFPPLAIFIGRPLRLVSVKLSGVDDRPEQLEMFAQADEKRRRLAAVVDRLNQSRDRGDPLKVRHGHSLDRGT